MDARLVIEGLFAVCSALAAMQFRSVLLELRDIAAKVNDHGERLAVVESQVKDLKERQ